MYREALGGRLVKGGARGVTLCSQYVHAASMYRKTGSECIYAVIPMHWHIIQAKSLKAELLCYLY